jgi:hypothetical protein
LVVAVSDRAGIDAVAKSRKMGHGQGLIKVRITALNQYNEAVQVMAGNLFAPCRPK